MTQGAFCFARSSAGRGTQILVQAADWLGCPYCNSVADSAGSGTIGLARHDDQLNDRSFDVLSLEALVLFPR